MEDAARRQKILKKMELNLSRLLAHEASSEKLAVAVKKVRDAKLSLFKWQREIAKYPEIDDNQKYKLNVERHLANPDENIKEWKEISDDEMIKSAQEGGI
jgi:hypothetical protein